MNESFVEQLQARLSQKMVCNPIAIFALNLMLDDQQVVSVSTLSKKVIIKDVAEVGDTAAYLTNRQLQTVLDGSYDLQQMYLNGQIQVEGSVMDLMRFRSFLK